MRGMRSTWCLLTFAMLGASSSAEGQVVRIERSLNPVPVTISGTLSPFALAVNGERVSAPAQQYSKLILNGDEVPTSPDAIRSFYLTTQDDKLELFGDEVLLLKMILPTIRAVEIDAQKVSFALEGEVIHLLVDGKEVPRSQEDDSGSWPVPADRDWIERPHAVELKGTGGSGRLYNLSFKEWRSALLNEWIVGLGPAEGVGYYYGGGDGYGLSVWRSMENRFAAGAQLAISSYSGSSPTDSFSNSSKGLRARLGYFPFLAGQAVWDFRRFLPGVLLGSMASG